MIPASRRNAISSWEGVMVHLVGMLGSFILYSCLLDIADSGHGSIMACFQHGRCSLECPLLEVHLFLELQKLRGAVHQSSLVDARVSADCAAYDATDTGGEYVPNRADQPTQDAS